MSLKSTARHAANPRHAARFYTGALGGRPARGNAIPAALFLWLVVIALVQVRRGGLTTGLNVPEVAALGVGSGLIVVAGTVAPRAVVLVLVALLVAGVFGAVPQVSAVLAGIEATIAGVVPSAPFGSSK